MGPQLRERISLRYGGRWVLLRRRTDLASLARLAKCQLSESRQQLIFNYKLAFEGYRFPTRNDILRSSWSLCTAV